MKSVIPFLALALGALAGCNSSPVQPDGFEVVIKSDHQHSRYCGHYIYHGTWYFVPEHRHGVGCGHEVLGGMYTIPED